MSGTLRNLTVSVVVESWEHMPADVVEEASRADVFVDDVVMSRLSAVVYEAAERYVAEHPELFRGGVV